MAYQIYPSRDSLAATTKIAELARSPNSRDRRTRAIATRAMIPRDFTNVNS